MPHQNTPSAVRAFPPQGREWVPFLRHPRPPGRGSSPERRAIGLNVHAVHNIGLTSRQARHTLRSMIVRETSHTRHHDLLILCARIGYSPHVRR